METIKGVADDPSPPTDDELRDFHLGRLEPQRLEEIAGLAQRDPEVQNRLNSTARATDPLLAILQQPVSDDPTHPGDPSYQSGMEKVKSLSVSQEIRPSEPTVADTTPAATMVATKKSKKQIGHYEIYSTLGRGGMGTVYKALDTRTGEFIALKVLPSYRGRQSSALARFKREMAAVNRLEHPHIVNALDAGEADGVYFLALEYVEGLDLSKLALKVGQISLADACEMIRHAAAGVHYGHRKGLIHRDIKPSNLILSTSGFVKMLDLGLALWKEGGEECNTLTTPSQFVGTLDFMAPEQFDDSHRVDSRADIYSLGCTLYYLIAGRAPFATGEFSNPLKKMQAHAELPPPPIREIRTDVPADLAEIVDQSLAKFPEDRPYSAAILARALKPFAANHDFATLLTRAGLPVKLSVIPDVEALLDADGDEPFELPQGASIVGNLAGLANIGPVRQPVTPAGDIPHNPNSRLIVAMVVGGAVLLTLGVLAGILLF